MPKFATFTKEVRDKFQELVDNHEVLYLTDVEKDDIWDMYLTSFPDGTNNIYKERREYDCNHCKQFLRPFGNVVAIKDGELISIWDVKVPGYYQEVADKLSAFVKGSAIKDIFVNDYKNLGVATSEQKLDGASKIVWNHFSFTLPDSRVNESSQSNEAMSLNQFTLNS